MPYTRRILHYSPGPTDLVGAVSDRVVAGCWFELKRQGGCGAGELTLKDEFSDRAEIDVGDWIACEFDTGVRWYLGKVVERAARAPAGVRLRLAGMSSELEEVHPGGFGPAAADGKLPHRYAGTDAFPHDPDYSDETVDSVNEPADVVSLLVQQYVEPNTHIQYDSALVTTPLAFSEVESLKFRGEETAAEIIRHLAVLARSAAWGVDETGTFFFLRKCSDVAAAWRIGRDVIRLDESRERDLLFNRLLLTGGTIYGPQEGTSGTLRSVYRWRGHYIQPASRAEHGERRIRLWCPWVRTALDSREFAREFFHSYAQPATRWLVEVGDQSSLPRPWNVRLRLEDADGNEIVTTFAESIRVKFDHRPRFHVRLGPPDPRELWPEPPQNERYVLPAAPASGFGGEEVTLSTSGSELPEDCPSESGSSSSLSGSSSSATEEF